jgi:hypothetical protein
MWLLLRPAGADWQGHGSCSAVLGQHEGQVAVQQRHWWHWWHWWHWITWLTLHQEHSTGSAAAWDMLPASRGSTSTRTATHTAASHQLLPAAHLGEDAHEQQGARQLLAPRWVAIRCQQVQQPRGAPASRAVDAVAGPPACCQVAWVALVPAGRQKVGAAAEARCNSAQHACSEVLAVRSSTGVAWQRSCSDML